MENTKQIGTCVEKSQKTKKSETKAFDERKDDKESNAQKNTHKGQPTRKACHDEADSLYACSSWIYSIEIFNQLFSRMQNF